MELTLEQYRLYQKNLHRRFSIVGWILLAYYGIMNVSSVVWLFLEMIYRILPAVSGGDLEAVASSAMKAAGSAWGYFLAAAVGLVILLVWKKPSYWKNEIWAKGRPMTFGSFMGLLCVFFSGQLVFQLVMILVEILLNSFGLSAVAGMQAVSMDTDNFSMFLYGGILAPIIEELLFRGLVQRTLLPWGKRFAILCSAFVFGIFHGNLFQAPYAFLVGLVLGYVACEYSIAWAMVLHMMNNLVLGDMLARLSAGMSDVAAALMLWAVLIPAALVAVVVLVVRRKEIRAFREDNPIHGIYAKCFFSCPGTVILMVVMGISMITTLFVMITPIY